VEPILSHGSWRDDAGQSASSSQPNPSPGMTPTEMARADEQGLDPRRLLFVRYLIATHRLGDQLEAGTAEDAVPVP
jgi:hypothetical protein